METRDRLARRVRLLVAATIAYNVVEGAVALTAGAAAGSKERAGTRRAATPAAERRILSEASGRTAA